MYGSVKPSYSKEGIEEEIEKKGVVESMIVVGVEEAFVQIIK